MFHLWTLALTLCQGDIDRTVAQTGKTADRPSAPVLYYTFASPVISGSPPLTDPARACFLLLSLAQDAL